MTEPSPPPPPQDAPATPPFVLAERYVFINRLGTGGIGKVYRAEDRVEHRLVAIKTLRVADDRQRALLLREARLLGLLSNAPTGDFVRLYDVIIQADQIFLVQELVEGTPLQDWQRGQPLAALLAIYRRMAQTLAVLHEHGIAHRDLKPGNVLVERASGRAVIMDLGLAIKTGEADVLTPTDTTIVGTPGYMSPESIRGRPYEAPGDIFALGVMLVEAVSGALPWEGGATSDVLVRIATEPIAETLARAPHIEAAGLSALVTSMLAKNPGDRPAAAAVAAALARLEDTSSIEAILPPRHTPSTAAATSPLAFFTTEHPTVIASISKTAPAWPLSGRWSMLTPRLVTAGGVAWVALVALIGREFGIAWSSIAWIGLLVIGAWLFGVTLAQRRQRTRNDAAPTDAVVSRINAIEDQVSRAGEMTQSLVMAIDHLGAQITPARLRDVIRESVVVALQDLRPPAQGSAEVDRAVALVSALRDAEPSPTGFVHHLKDYGAVIGAGITVIAGLIGLLNTTELWHPNSAPEILSFGGSGARLRHGAPFLVSVEAKDPNGDALTFAWATSAGRMQANGGTDSAAMWIPPRSLEARLVSLTVIVHDGKRATTRTRTMQVNRPPAGALAVRGNVTVGSTVRLSSGASDQDGDPLTFAWVVSSGVLADKTGPTVLWTAPHQPGTVEVICDVSDGYESTPLSMSITVSR